MENQDFTQVFNEINHISLNYEDLLSHFLEYFEANKASIEPKFLISKTQLNKKLESINLWPALLSSPAFLEAAVLSARQAVVIAMLSITLEHSFEEEQFKQLCLNCNCQSPKRYYIQEAFSEISKEEFFQSLLLTEDSLTDLQNQCLNIFIDFESETYSRITSKNKDLMSQTLLTKKIITTRQNIFQLLIHDKI